MDVGDDNGTRLNINKKQSMNLTPLSSHNSNKDAKGAGAKMVNQLDKLIEIVATG